MYIVHFPQKKNKEEEKYIHNDYLARNCRSAWRKTKLENKLLSRKTHNLLSHCCQKIISILKANKIKISSDNSKVNQVNKVLCIHLTHNVI